MVITHLARNTPLLCWHLKPYGTADVHEKGNGKYLKHKAKHRLLETKQNLK